MIERFYFIAFCGFVAGFLFCRFLMSRLKAHGFLKMEVTQNE